MNVGELKKQLSFVPDSAEVYYQDPNFGGRYDLADPDEFTLVWKTAENALYISFPFCEEVE